MVMKNKVIFKIVVMCLIASPLYAMRGAYASLMRQSFQNSNRTQKTTPAKRLNQRALQHSQTKSLSASSAPVLKNGSYKNKQLLFQPIKQETKAPVVQPIKEETIVREEKHTSADAPILKETSTQKNVSAPKDEDTVIANNAFKKETDKTNQDKVKSAESLQSFIARNKIKAHNPYANSEMIDDEEGIGKKREHYVSEEQEKEREEPVDLYQRRLNEFNESQKQYQQLAKKYELPSTEKSIKYTPEVNDKNKVNKQLDADPAANKRSKKTAQGFQFGQMIASGFNNVCSDDDTNKANNQNSVTMVKDKLPSKENDNDSKESKNAIPKNESASSFQVGQMVVNGENTIINGLHAAWKYGQNGVWYLLNNGLWKPMDWFSTTQYEKDPVTKQNVIVIKSKLRMYFEKYICKENMNFIAPLMRIGTGLLICMLWYNPGLFGKRMEDSALTLWVAKLGLSTIQIISGETPAAALGTIGLSKFASVLIPYISSWFGVGGAVAATNNVPSMPNDKILAIKDAVNLSSSASNDAKKIGWGAWAFSWMKSVATWTSWYKTISALKFKNSDKVDISKVHTTTSESDAIQKEIFSQLSDGIKTKFLETPPKFENAKSGAEYWQKIFNIASAEDQEKLLLLMTQSKAKFILKN